MWEDNIDEKRIAVVMWIWYLYNQHLVCGHECHYVEEYGFVPECGCPMHDKGE